MIKDFIGHDKLEPKAPRRLRQKSDIFAPRPVFRVKTISVRALPLLPGRSKRGLLSAAGVNFVCALGGAGIAAKRREGDGVTPRGRFAILTWLARFDRRGAVRAGRQSIGKKLGWCDDPTAPVYNRPIFLPSAVSHEAMWREDRLYDVVGVVDYNLRPRVRGRGSAIFIHIAKPAFAPTAGCIALNAPDLARLTSRLSAKAQIAIGALRAPKIADPTRT